MRTEEKIITENNEMKLELTKLRVKTDIQNKKILDAQI